jgi:hypothetical protein
MAFFGIKKKQSKSSMALAQIVPELMKLCTAQQVEIQELKEKFAALVSQIQNLPEVILREQQVLLKNGNDLLNAQNEEKQRLQVLKMDRMQANILELEAKIVVLEGQTIDFAEIRDEQMRLGKEHLLHNQQREEMYQLEVLKMDVTTQLMLELEQSKKQRLSSVVSPAPAEQLAVETTVRSPPTSTTHRSGGRPCATSARQQLRKTASRVPSPAHKAIVSPKWRVADDERMVPRAPNSPSEEDSRSPYVDATPVHTTNT